MSNGTQFDRTAPLTKTGSMPATSRKWCPATFAPHDCNRVYIRKPGFFKCNQQIKTAGNTARTSEIARGNPVTGKFENDMENFESEAADYAKSITKNDTYQKYIQDAFIAGVKSKGNFREFQRCPVCEGLGYVKNPFMGTTSSGLTMSCTVCLGLKIIEKPH